MMEWPKKAVKPGRKGKEGRVWDTAKGKEKAQLRNYNEKSAAT